MEETHDLLQLMEEARTARENRLRSIKISLIAASALIALVAASYLIS